MDSREVKNTGGKVTSQSRFADGHSGSIFDFLQNAVILKNRHGRDRLIRRRRSNRPGNSQATRLRACRRNVHRGRACRRRSARLRGLRLAMAPGRAFRRPATCPSQQAGHARASTLCRATRLGHCGAYSARARHRRPTCSPRSAAAQCQPRASERCLLASASAPAWPSRSSRTCSGTPAATRWLTPVTTPERCRLGSVTATSSTRRAIPNSRPIA